MMLDSVLHLLEGNLINLISLLVSLGALLIAVTISRREQVNDNSWETYKSYNSPEVRKGRALTFSIVQQHQEFANRKDYEAYFEQDAHKEQRQYYHDLAAFYHQTGLLLAQKFLDANFTLSLVGPGLEDRWNLFRSISTFYGKDAKPYEGMYFLYGAYLRWKQSRPAKLGRRLKKARERTQHLTTSNVTLDTIIEE